MKKSFLLVLLIAALPAVCLAQSGGNADIQKLHDILDRIYDDMIPLCGRLTTVARGIAGFGAIFYIAARAGRSLAAAEPIDFFPLLRPFVLAVLIGIYPLVLGVINGILQPTVDATNELVTQSDNAVKELMRVEYELLAKGKAELPPGSPGTNDQEMQEYYKYLNAQTAGEEDSRGFWSLMWGKVEGTILYYVQLIVSKILQILFYAAALCIDAMRTFHLVILAIVGPFVFALSVYDGFQHTLSVWLARYINVYMWLPVANLFGAMISRIQENLIKNDIEAVLAGGNNATYSLTSVAYIVFLVVGIVGYFTVPSIANYIVHASGGNALLSKFQFAARTAVVAGTGGAGAAAGPSSAAGASAAGSAAADTGASDKLRYPMADAANSEGYNKDAGHQFNQISGK
ncbi:conjugative transposon protein TraJ [Chitinophaga cymbidii]|uniref:Conjugative transposon TraJ C-terminal domain-containing protein n=1 Tax=Chitinophaga cymbidii TaxID=1096750 RepID=A0A512RS92_9BACT|nr:conjugative transposon protein TraJ [Chitinophaga cymbidii]GEP98565.1 hypothetical protein CCY01nite_48250 [Chitinophaga cymbidii]